MMQSLWDLYITIGNVNSRWNFYDKPYKSIDTIWSSNHDAFRFIETYMDNDGKSEILRDTRIIKYKDDIRKRSLHTVSAFFMGVYLAECLGLNIHDSDGFGFLFYWFNICLYHDFGYIYENHSENEPLDKMQAKGIKGFQDEYGITYHSKYCYKSYCYKDTNMYFKYMAQGSPSLKAKIEHGIAGGIFIYDRLKQIYYKSRENSDNKKEHKGAKFSVKALNFLRTVKPDIQLSQATYRDYTRVANAIIAHNIWVSTAQEIGIATPTISLNKRNQELFILALVDTLEPIKKYESNDVTVLHDVKLGFTAANNAIQVQMNNEAYEHCYKGIKTDLEKWLDVIVAEEVLPDQKGKVITITINKG